MRVNLSKNEYTQLSRITEFTGHKNRLPLKALKNFNSGKSFLKKKSNIDTLANGGKMTDC